MRGCGTTTDRHRYYGGRADRVLLRRSGPRGLRGRTPLVREPVRARCAGWERERFVVGQDDVRSRGVRSSLLAPARGISREPDTYFVCNTNRYHLSDRFLLFARIAELYDACLRLSTRAAHA